MKNFASRIAVAAVSASRSSAVSAAAVVLGDHDRRISIESELVHHAGLQKMSKLFLAHEHRSGKSRLLCNRKNRGNFDDTISARQSVPGDLVLVGAHAAEH